MGASPRERALPTLNWIGKEAVVNHHRQVPFRLLRDVPSLSCGDPGSGNLIVQGDNLLALKALLPYYAGQVKCVYIDPPYNTGNEGWIYNDNTNSPVIKKWLGEVVKGENETLDRHDRWLCMMYPRLALLRQFLRDDGAIFISIDDGEIGHIRMLLDEIFGSANFICNFVWEKKHSRANDAKHVSDNHDFILLYARDIEKLRMNRLQRTAEANARYKNPDDDPRGPWASEPLQVKTPSQAYIYEIITPAGRKINPPEGRSWAFGRERYDELVRDGRIYFGADGKNVPRLKKFLSDVGQFIPLTIWPRTEVGDNQEAKSEVKEILAERKISFDSPKPTRLIRRILELASDKDSLILDSFCGSGSTGHAVLNQNNSDGGTRRFLLIEMQKNIATEVAASRLRQVAVGLGKDVGFRFCELGDPLFDESGKIRPSVTFAELARHVYFAETGEPLPKERVGKSPFLGECRGVGIYLLYNGILGDKSAAGGNVLTRQVLGALPPYSGQKIVYCAGNLLGKERLEAENIVVRQTPYEIRVA